MKLLQANEALRKIAPPAAGIYIPEPVVHFAAPVSTDFLVSQMPKLPSGNITSQMNDRKVALGQKIDPNTNINTKVVALPESYLSKQIHQKMRLIIKPKLLHCISPLLAVPNHSVLAFLKSQEVLSHRK